jgi:hypothetical protein
MEKEIFEKNEIVEKSTLAGLQSVRHKAVLAGPVSVVEIEAQEDEEIPEDLGDFAFIRHLQKKANEKIAKNELKSERRRLWKLHKFEKPEHLKTRYSAIISETKEIPLYKVKNRLSHKDDPFQRVFVIRYNIDDDRYTIFWDEYTFWSPTDPKWIRFKDKYGFPAKGTEITVRWNTYKGQYTPVL